MTAILTKAVANGTKTAAISLNGNYYTVRIDGAVAIESADICRAPKGAPVAYVLYDFNGKAVAKVGLTAAERDQLTAAKAAATVEDPITEYVILGNRYGAALDALTSIDHTAPGLTMATINAAKAEAAAAKTALDAHIMAHQAAITAYEAAEQARRAEAAERNQWQ